MATIVLGMIIAYASWLGMMLVHEAGHVFHAWLGGGRVVSASIPLLGFSQTIVHPNPHELFVVWGGPVWGVGIPLVVCGARWVLRRKVPQVVRYFVGFCLIANGAYIGLGPVIRSGDAADMLRLGVRPWGMVLFGAACIVVGLMLWHYIPALSLSTWRSAEKHNPCQS